MKWLSWRVRGGNLGSQGSLFATASALLMTLVGCNDQFTSAEGVGGDGSGGQASEGPSGGMPGTGGAAPATGGAPSTGGADAATGGISESTGGSTTAVACWEPFVCDGSHKLGSRVSAHGKNWTCQDATYCINCGAYPACNPGEYYQGATPWQCQAAWKDEGECE